MCALSPEESRVSSLGCVICGGQVAGNESQLGQQKRERDTEIN